MNIYVMDKGFVLCGIPTYESNDALFITLKCCGVIRYWGTTQGLGELAFKGPTDKTIIDREPDSTEISRRAIFRRIPCDVTQVRWKQWIAQQMN